MYSFIAWITTSVPNFNKGSINPLAVLTKHLVTFFASQKHVTNLSFQYNSQLRIIQLTGWSQHILVWGIWLDKQFEKQQ